MDDVQRLQEENRNLREEVESYRQRELASLKEALAQAKDEADHFRREAHRNADVGRKIHTEMQAEINKLRGQLEAKERLGNARTLGRS